jgi:hypothetical protein
VTDCPEFREILALPELPEQPEYPDQTVPPECQVRRNDLITFPLTILDDHQSNYFKVFLVLLERLVPPVVRLLHRLAAVEVVEEVALLPTQHPPHPPALPRHLPRLRRHLLPLPPQQML